MALSMDGGDSNEFTQQGYGDKEPRWDEKIKWFQCPNDNEPHAYRLVAKPFYFAQHWIVTKKRDGTKGKAFAALCKNYDSTSNKYAENGCVYCNYKALAAKQLAAIKYKDWPESIQRMNARSTMATNAIVREIQQAGAPANNAGGWTFIQPIKFPEGFSNTIKEKMDKFNKIAGVVYGFNHKEHGKDLLVTFNEAAKEKAKMYQLDLGEKTPLTPEELAHVKFLTDFKEHLRYPSDESCEKALQQFGYYDLLESLNASHNLKQITQTSAPAEETQAQPQTQTPAAVMGKGFETEANGGMAEATGGES